jgi:hypothetical protein
VLGSQVFFPWFLFWSRAQSSANICRLSCTFCGCFLLILRFVFGGNMVLLGLYILCSIMGLNRHSYGTEILEYLLLNSASQLTQFWNSFECFFVGVAVFMFSFVLWRLILRCYAYMRHPYFGYVTILDAPCFKKEVVI